MKESALVGDLFEGTEIKSPVMVMMPPTIVVAATSTPTVVMAVAVDLDYRSLLSAESIGRCDWHCSRRQSRSQDKSPNSKSD